MRDTLTNYVHDIKHFQRLLENKEHQWLRNSKKYSLYWVKLSSSNSVNLKQLRKIHEFFNKEQV